MWMVNHVIGKSDFNKTIQDVFAISSRPDVWLACSYAFGLWIGAKRAEFVGALG